MFSLFNLGDAKGLVPVAIAALIGAAVWYLIAQARGRQRDNQLADWESGLTTHGQTVDLSALDALLHPTTGSNAGSNNIGGNGSVPQARPATASNAFESIPQTQGA
jgi:hypothetical protein